MAELDTIDIERKDLKIVKSIFARHLPYKQVWAYGSRVKWTATHTSDLDCVVFGATDSEIADAKEAFDESDIHFEVQLLNWEIIPDDFKENIQEQYFVLQNKLDWKETTLGEVCDRIGDGLHRTPQYTTDGKYYFINGSNLKKGQIVIKQDTKRVDYKEFQEHKKDLGLNTILLSINGTIGNLAKYKNELCILGKSAAYLNIKDGISKNFTYYLMLDSKFQNDISHHANGSTIKNVSLVQLKSYPILLPPLAEQKAIASVLSSLDDKIDLLHRQNKTLESIAETLFRHWFIEEVRDDWEEKTLDKVAYYLNGLACQKYPPKNDIDKLPVLKIKDLRTGLSDASDWATSNVPEEYVIQNGDIVFSWSGSLLVKIWDGMICILNQHLFKVTSDQYPKWFVYLWTKHHLRKFTAIAESKATTMGHIKRCDLASSMVTIPTSPELKDMSKAMTPIIDKIILNNIQISKLTTIRDILLPKLMSGDVRVEYEKII